MEGIPVVREMIKQVIKLFLSIRMDFGFILKICSDL